MLAGGLSTPFGVMHVLWLDLVIVLPVAGLVVLTTSRGRRSTPMVALAAGGIVLASIGAYASFVEPSRLVAEQATVSLPSERAGSSPVRLAVIADLQFERVGGMSARPSGG